MDDMPRGPKTIVISLDESYEEIARKLIDEHFKGSNKDVYIRRVPPSRSLAEVVANLAVELWTPIEKILVMEGIDKNERDRVFGAVQLASWNQVCTDLFGSHIQIVAKERTDE